MQVKLFWLRKNDKIFHMKFVWEVEKKKEEER